MSNALGLVAPTSSLLGIPPELRLRIYHHLFSDSIIRLHVEIGEDENGETDCTAMTKAKQYRSAITITCRQLRQESQVLLYQQTTVRICSVGDIVRGEHVKLIPQRIREKTAKLELDFDMVEQVSFMQFLPSLQTLVLKRHRILCHSFIENVSDAAMLRLAKGHCMDRTCQPGCARTFEEIVLAILGGSDSQSLVSSQSTQ